DRAPPRTRLVLDCPLSGDGPLPWLELAMRLLKWQNQPPSFLWTQDEAPRLLLSLGPMPGNAIGHLVAPQQSRSMYWPLTTSHNPSIDAAQAAFSAEQRQAIENRALSLDTFFTSLAR